MARIGPEVGLQPVEQRLQLGGGAGEVHGRHHHQLVGGIDQLVHLRHVVVDDATAARLLGRFAVGRPDACRTRGKRLARIAPLAGLDGERRHRRKRQLVVGALVDARLEQQVGQVSAAAVDAWRSYDDQAVHRGGSLLSVGCNRGRAV